ncbi:MAG: thiamine biosynthesis protein ThiS [Gammaproteobacteria bacterium HGW-Gammaproteobacteria-8]|nr:MAG: thiamine biosynthesis protein ThiS [Gammaproteobacteria bacterium HGW-Gammaproteobacteria-8]
MDITLNGSTHQVPAGATIEALLQQLGLGDKRVAVERNGEIVPRSRHATQSFSAGDRIEIVHAIGGG